MSNQKSEEEKKEKTKVLTNQGKEVEAEKSDNSKKVEKPFEVTEQEEIEYLNTEREEETETCEKEGIPEVSSKEQEEKSSQLIEKLQEEIKVKETEIKELQQQLEELKDKYLRQLAELDNVRKRTEREKEDYFQYALTDLLREILPIIDNFERALKTPDEVDGRTFREGVELIYRMLLNLLQRHGVRPIELQNDKFDPNLHHALASEESDEVSEPKIKEELQKGYFIHNRLLRPTMVKVIIPKKN